MNDVGDIMGERKVVVISGGTSGIGLASAKILAEEGWYPVILGTSEENGRLAEKEVGSARFISCDVTKTEEVDKAVKEAAACGDIHGIVASAGKYKEGLLDDMADEEIQQLFDVNVFGVMRLVRAALPFLRKTHGSIVAVSSDAALQGNVQCSLYGATKGAVTAFIRSLALELAIDGIRANVVCPGDVDTPMLDRQLKDYGGTKEEMKNWYPLMRIARAEEVGNIIAFLLSDKASYMTGAIIPVDGGLTDW